MKPAQSNWSAGSVVRAEDRCSQPSDTFGPVPFGLPCRPHHFSIVAAMEWGAVIWAFACDEQELMRLRVAGVR